MKVKQRTYLLLALAGLLALVGAVVDLWFYTVGAIGVTLYVVGSLLTFRSTVRQLDVDIQREAIRETSGKDLFVNVCVSLCSNLNVVASFTDLIPDDYVLTEAADPVSLMLLKGQRILVRYRLKAIRDADLQISRSALSVETDLYAHTLYLTTTPVEVRCPAPLGGTGEMAAGGIAQIGRGTDAPTYGTRTSTRTGYGFELSHVRPYNPTDPLKRIDWKASAKLNELMTKVFFAELDDSGIGFGAPITVVVDQTGGLDGTAEGQIARDFSAQIVEYIARFASTNESLVSVVTFDDEGISPVALQEVPTHVSRWKRALERPRPEPSRQQPARSRSGITNIEAQRFEKHLRRTADRDGARFRDVISYLYAHREGYLRELRHSPAYQAVADSATPPQRSALILISDLETDVDPLIEGMRYASHAGSRVFLVSFFSKLFQRFQDVFIASETVYDDYERYKVQLGKVAAVTEVKVIEAPSVDYLTFLERGGVD